MVRKGPAEKVTCEPSLGGGVEVDHAGSWGESIPGRGTSLSRGPEVGACLACLRKSKSLEQSEKEDEGVGDENRTGSQ